jgi:uncharacterized protein YraI
MLKNALRLSLALWFALAMLMTQQPLAAAGLATFTVNVKSTFLRTQPGFAASAAYSVFKGQNYTVLGRTADSSWVQLDFAGASTGAPWIFSSYGSIAGRLAEVPVTGVVQTAVVAATVAPSIAGSFAPMNVKWTVAVKSLYGLAAPDPHASRVYSFFKGQSYPATARSTDSNWLLLDLWGGAQAWVPALNGTVQGSVADLPTRIATIALPAATPPPSVPTTFGAVLPTVSAKARAIYQLGLSLGNNPRAFSKIGDCNSVAPFFLAPFDTGEYRLGDTYAPLQTTIDNFSGSFNRDGAAAHIGLNVDSIMDPDWADPHICLKGETPLSCEVRIQKPSLAIVSLGTNGSWQTNDQYETGMRHILDQLISQGVLPILSTKVDDLEGGDRFNQIVVRLAGEYQLPLWDFASAARALPGDGLADTYHPTWGRAYYDRGPVFAGWQVRNLTALQSLDIVWRGVK